MYEEIYEYSADPSWIKLKSDDRYNTRTRWRKLDKKCRVSLDGFQCRHCLAYVYTQPVLSGVQNRNHCPYCLWSRHVDHIQPGDRMSACKAIMQPVGLTVKGRQNKYGGWIIGELMLIHRCNDCGKLSINRIAADDQAERILELFQESLSLDINTRNQLEGIGIQMLQEGHARLVVCQLQGVCQI
jgi:hypothetical protein